MPFQLALTKFFTSELFSCLPKVDHVITVMKRAYYIKLHVNILTTRKAKYKIIKKHFMKRTKLSEDFDQTNQHIFGFLHIADTTSQSLQDVRNFLCR